MSPDAEDPGVGGGRRPGEATAIVTGATGLVGHPLREALRARGVGVRALSRRPPDGATNPPSSGVRWTVLDLAAEPPRGGFPPADLGPAESLFHTAPLWLLPPWLPRWAETGVRRVVALSSTSRTTKMSSRSRRDREVARRLAEAEDAVRAICAEYGIRWTVLRPTLIYDGERDGNVALIARSIRRLRIFPLAGQGSGLRQPVHAAEIAAACLQVHDNPSTFDRAYETPGGETLAYREMVRRIGLGIGREPRLLPLPTPLLRLALSSARWLPGLGHLTPDMADRMNENLVFDASDARRDFGYSPGPFRFPRAYAC